MIANAIKMQNYAGESPASIQVEYVQLDDGYQNAMGDWLECNKWVNVIKSDFFTGNTNHLSLYFQVNFLMAFRRW
jgi:hypothetical protein